MSGEGWYGDPCSRHEHRFWDGRAWTSQIADGGAVAADLLGPVSAPPPEPASPAGGSTVLSPPGFFQATVGLQRQAFNGFAIASLATAVGALLVALIPLDVATGDLFFGVPMILSVIFGHIAIDQIRRSDATQRGRGMAIAGLVVSWISLALLTIAVLGTVYDHVSAL